MRSVLLVCSLALAACGPGYTPTLAPVAEQTAYVGMFLTVDLEAVSRGGSLSYEYTALRNSGEVDFGKRPEQERPDIATTKADGTSAQFRWRPPSWAVGEWTFTFRVKEDGGVPSEQTVQITVKPTREQSIGFIEPQNEGVSIDLAAQPCFLISLVVAARQIPVGIVLSASPVLQNAAVEMKPGSGQGTFEGLYRFCPSAAQAQAQSVYSVTFLAKTTSEAENYEKVGVVVARKPYLLGLRGH